MFCGTKLAHEMEFGVSGLILSTRLGLKIYSASRLADGVGYGHSACIIRS